MRGVHAYSHQYINSRNVVEKGGEGLGALVAYVEELDHKVAPQLVINDSNWNGARLILQEVAIVGSLKLCLQV